jgi:flavin reductase (DIM6/NTAB) family NADH-FMN oxidoreductase RutF
VEGNTINGQPFEPATNGAPLITAAPAWVEGRVISEVDTGDHSCIVAEVTNAGLREPDPKVLTLDEVGVKYGG